MPGTSAGQGAASSMAVAADEDGDDEEAAGDSDDALGPAQVCVIASDVKCKLLPSDARRW